jgi:hypothetical protein|tara:strand:- start:565 stop:813 length:249 start_codon:yes stop_codon:yes gene_type:complete
MAYNMREELLKASRIHFKAHIEKHRINVENLLNNSVGVAEHPDLMDTIEKELGIIAEYDDKLAVVDKYFSKDFGEVKTLLNE